ncbi:MAG: DUF6259 domain-containing protein [bacterium]|nr:DUF6259 domain-containing protein [bacterium]
MKELFTTFCVCLIYAASALEVCTPAVTVRLRDPSPGRAPVVTGLVSRAGREYAALCPAPDLFRVQMRCVSALTNVVHGSAREAKIVETMVKDDGFDFVYSGFSSPLERVVCSVRPDAADGKLRWRISALPKAGFAVCEVDYPIINLACQLGAEGEDDRLLGGTRRNWGMIVNPGRTMNPKKWDSLFGEQPGSLYAQFGCFYDSAGGVYAASEDGKCQDKAMVWRRVADALQVFWQHRTWSESAYSLDYDVVTTCFTGAGGEPADWHDAADIYRAWARRQYWCRQTLVEKKNLPDWMRDAPAMLRWSRPWYTQPDDMRAWLERYWKAKFPTAPLLGAAWGWEKQGTWITPDYFPLYPDDATFARCVKIQRAADTHFFPWPSGYNWTLSHFRTDGTFLYESSNAFRRVEHLMAKNADGSTLLRKPDWYNGGEMATMCPGDARVREYWVREIVAPLLDRGMELIQFDQVNGGLTRPCWCRAHGHVPGQGAWRTEAIRAQLDLVEAEACKRGIPLVMGFEDPNEFYLDRVGVADYRDCELQASNRLPASVWSYLYHEYAAPFQSNPKRGNRWMQAHCAVDGQIPFLTPAFEDVLPNAGGFSNGGFEKVEPKTGKVQGWNYWHGDVKGGTFTVEKQDVAEGRHALRTMSKDPDDALWLAQDTPVWQRLIVGQHYRLSAKVKVIKAPKNATLSVSVYTPGWKGLGASSVTRDRFPKPEEGWQRVQGTVLTMPRGVGNGHVCLRMHSGEVLVDDLRLEVVNEKGEGVPLPVGDDAYTKFMQAWVTLYHGEGRDFLAHGRQIRTPKIVCATHRVNFPLKSMGGFSVERPVVEAQAYESLDGRRRALILANATEQDQFVEWLDCGESRHMTMQADSVACVPLAGR